MKIVKRVLLVLLIIVISVAGFYTYQGYNIYKEAIEDVSVEEKVKEIKEATDNYVEIKDLPQDYLNAVVAVEDRRFYIHSGIDIISICRAVVNDIKELKLVEGGSTITQQLAKNVYFTQRKEFTRKIAEVFMAFEIEKNCSKEQILELYVNTSYFGDGYYCVGDASEGYFDKKPIDMDLYECTLLAGIPNAPSVYAPTKNPELAKQRQGQVIKKMVKYGFLSKEQGNKIMEEDYYEQSDKRNGK
jgi:membrane peptidoglycan carboxypeptidase